MHFFKNLPVDVYIGLMARTACLVGNSSSGIREGAFIGTPVVNVGTRQVGRERGINVIDVDYLAEDIFAAMEKQVATGRFEPDTVYGDGRAGDRIARILAESGDVATQKRITY
jgi:UDP-N-acetylglucosamine 2-epimerase